MSAVFGHIVFFGAGKQKASKVTTWASHDYFGTNCYFTGYASLRVAQNSALGRSRGMAGDKEHVKNFGHTVPTPIGFCAEFTLVSVLRTHVHWNLIEDQEYALDIGSPEGSCLK